jgi:acyl carrier protein
MLNHTLTISAALEEIVRRFAPRDRAGMPLAPDTRLVDDFGIDSPRMIDIVLEVEDRFGITVEDDAISRVRTFGEVLALVEKLAGDVPQS